MSVQSLSLFPTKILLQVARREPQGEAVTHPHNQSTKCTAEQKEHIASHRTVVLQPGVFTSWYQQPRLTAPYTVLIAHAASRYNIQFWWTHSTILKKTALSPIKCSQSKDGRTDFRCSKHYFPHVACTSNNTVLFLTFTVIEIKMLNSYNNIAGFI